MNCKICNGEVKFYLSECRDYTHKVNFNQCFEIHTCENCGCGYTRPLLSFDQLSEYYPDVYEPYSGKNGLRAKFMQASRKKDLKLIGSMLITGETSLFEIGAGNGDFLNLAKKSGYKIFGLEMSAQGIKYAKLNYNIDIVQDNAEQYTFEKKYSVIVARHVLEHLASFDEVLDKIGSKGLEDSGVLLLKIPRFDSMEVKLFGKYAWGLDTPRHLNHFTKKSMHILLENKGFSDIRITGQQNLLDYVRSYKRLIENQKKVLRILLGISAPFFLVAYFFMFIKPNRMTVLARKA